MLKIVQIVALLQGIFLIFVLLKNKANYKSITLWLLLGSIVSVMLYLIGDDESNLFLGEGDFFLFDSSLFITFLFLFFRYYKSGKKKFVKGDLLFFVPNLIYFGIELSEVSGNPYESIFEIPEFLVELTFMAYLIYIIVDVLKSKERNWMLYFTIPMALILGLSYFNDVLLFFDFKEIELSPGQDIDSYIVLVVVFLFYFISYSLIDKSKSLLPMAESNKYGVSNLKPQQITQYKSSLVSLMEDDKLFRDQGLSLQVVSEKMEVPRKYISEVLNLHMKISFQDFVNGYRIREFKKHLLEQNHESYTLFGIAREVGFNSKSSFNSIFKKIVGMTPTQYKKSISTDKIGTE